MRLLRSLVAASLACGAALTAAAADGRSWTLRVHGAIVDSNGGNEPRLENGFSSDVDGGGGFDLGVEYRVSERLGVELTTLFAGLDIGTRFSANRAAASSFGLSVTPVTLGLPIHVGSGKRVDLFVAPTLSVVHYTDAGWTADRWGMRSSVDAGTDIGPGMALGLDVPIGRGKWAMSTGLRYIETETGGIDIDPLIVAIGFAYRFGGS